MEPSNRPEANDIPILNVFLGDGGWSGKTDNSRFFKLDIDVAGPVSFDPHIVVDEGDDFRFGCFEAVLAHTG